MNEKIVVGYDGSERARDAVALTGLLAEEGSAVIFAYVFEHQPPWTSGERTYQLQHREDIQGVERRLAGDHVPLPYGARVGFRPVASTSDARGLHDLAEESDADVVVLGSTHQGPIGRVLVGSVGETLTRGGPCAIAIAPKGFHDSRPDVLGVIGCGFDGSPESQVALRHAHALALQKKAALRPIAVVEWRDHVADRLQAALAGLDASVPVEESVRSGVPAEELAGAARETDLLVVGSRGYGPLRSALAGAVSGTLMRTCPAPLMLLPRGASEEGQPSEAAG